MIAKGIIKTGEYYDSVTLMLVAKELNSAEGVIDSGVVMGTAENKAILKASNILFGRSTSDDLKSLDEKTFLDVFDGVPQAEIKKTDLEKGIGIIDALNERSGFLKSNSEARRALKENSIAINKEKVTEEYHISTNDLISNKYILLQRGKKNYFLLKAL